MRPSSLFGLCAFLTLVIGSATAALAQSAETEDRQTITDNAAADKARMLVPYEVTLAEKVLTNVENHFTDQTIHWHPVGCRNVVTPPERTRGGHHRDDRSVGHASRPMPRLRRASVLIRVD
jgi:hypothetical protein